MPNYDHVTFTPQTDASEDPATNETDLKDADDRIYLRTQYSTFAAP